MPSPEDYDLPVSLMLGVPVRIIQGGLEDALKALNALSDRHTKKVANGR